jgi:protein-tyrosine phosphatase
MVDIHCHILPGLDDGADSLEEAVCMGEAAIADGVTHVVCTPHANSVFSFDYALVRRALEALRTRFGDRLILATGCDFQLTPENLTDLRRDAARFCIHQRDYLLVELNEFSIPPAVDRALHEIQLAGLRPIVTHPERNGILRGRPQRLRDWVRQGCYAQVTAGALTGGFGPAAQRHAENWIEQGLIHFIASDAHNTRRRPMYLRPAYDLAVKRFGADKARALFQDNPLAAFEGKPLPHVPEVAEKPPRRRKRFFFF